MELAPYDTLSREVEERVVDVKQRGRGEELIHRDATRKLAITPPLVAIFPIHCASAGRRIVQVERRPKATMHDVAC